MESSNKHKKTIGRILKVNHAGEAGAIRIYQAQILVCRYLHPSIVPFLKDTLAHEIVHKRLFEGAMPKRNARPCRALWLWGIGGWLLGLTTALLGKNMVWLCTEAVEETVHLHLEEQLIFLRGKDNELVVLIESIKEEELSHLDHATANINNRGRLAKIVQWKIKTATEFIIWLSTQGDSTRMVQAIKY
ncbi:MAG: demethoxyubiquinone hydroxylase family protein [Rhizobiales bacterium]|nr:demethoxyubiquinone hydroxylase family protein [Hyphomicrobiales bacterium]